MRQTGIPHCSWYDVEWVRCVRCGGDGEYVECYDDLCQAKGRCIHEAANNVCNLCGGTGVITAELEERWLDRDTFEAVTAPDPDLWNQGTLHAVACDRRDGGEHGDG